MRALTVPSDNPPPDGVRLPYGLFEYDVTVASPGDTADVTYVLPDEGVVPTSVHMLQNGVWTDYADHTSLDPVNGEVTVALRDGGEGDETGAADGVIKDPSGLSTSQSDDLGHERVGRGGAELHLPARALQRDTTGTGCTGATPVATTGGSVNAAGDSAALGNGSSWFWGSPTPLEYSRNYRLSVITPLPASGWRLTGRNCDPDGNATAIVGPNAIVLRLANSTGDRTGSMHLHVHGLGVMGRSPRARVVCATPPRTPPIRSQPACRARRSSSMTTAAFSSPSDLCVTPVSTDSAGACVSAQVANGNYWVREKAAPAGWNTIPNIAYGGDAFGQSPIQPYNQQVTVNNSNPTTRRFVNRRSNPALTAGVWAEYFVGAGPVGFDRAERDGVRERGEELRQFACVDAVADEDLQLCRDRDCEPEHVRVVEHAGWCELSQRHDRCRVREPGRRHELGCRAPARDQFGFEPGGVHHRREPDRAQR